MTLTKLANVRTQRRIAATTRIVHLKPIKGMSFLVAIGMTVPPSEEPVATIPYTLERFL